jgi:hypothetical protein
VTDPLDLIQEIDSLARELNAAVRAVEDTITLADARRLVHLLLEAEGWLQGVRTVLLGPTPPPAS